MALTGGGATSRSWPSRPGARARAGGDRGRARCPSCASALDGTGIEPRRRAGGAPSPPPTSRDWVMSAIVGSAGLAPTLAAARHGGVMALANKESLVCAGAVLLRTASTAGGAVIPVDSEHSAIFQVLDRRAAARGRAADPDRLGRPVPRLDHAAQMADATPEQAVAHPNWSMGAKISVDSRDDDEQGPGDDRGRLPVRHAARADRRADPSAVDRPQPGGVRRRLDCCPARAAGHARADRLRVRLAGPAPSAGAAARPGGARAADFAPADAERFPALRLAGEVLAPAGGGGGDERRRTRSASPPSSTAGSAFLTWRCWSEHVLEKLGPEAAAFGPGYDLEAVTALDSAARRLGEIWVAAFIGR